MVPYSPLPSRWVGLVSMTLVAPGPSVEPDVPPVQTLWLSHTEYGPVSVPHLDPETVLDADLSLIISLHIHLSYYVQTGDRDVRGRGYTSR